MSAATPGPTQGPTSSPTAPDPFTERVVLADLYDADWTLRHPFGIGVINRATVLIPHPLTSVVYADGSTTQPSISQRSIVAGIIAGDQWRLAAAHQTD